MDNSQNEQAALVLARLIQTGLASELPENLPPEWAAAYNAVRAAPNTGLYQRGSVFLEAIAGQEFATHMEIEVNEAYQRLENTPQDQLRVYSGWETLETPPPQPAAVSGVFTRPSLNLLVGAPGAKKTWLALDLAVAVANGETWLGHATTASPTLILDEEGGLQRTWERLGRVMRGHNALRLTPVHFIPPSGFNFNQESSADSLIARARSLGVGLIIIDALVNVMPGCDENNVLSVQPVLANLRRVAREANAAVVVVHHTNKQGMFRGSTSLASGVDHLLVVESSPQDDLVELTTAKARDIEPVALTALCHFAPDSFHITRADQLASTKITTPAFVLLQDLSQRTSATTAELSTPQRTASRTRTLLSELAAAGYIRRTNSGSRGTRAIYGLTELGRSTLT